MYNPRTGDYGQKPSGRLPTREGTIYHQKAETKGPMSYFAQTIFLDHPQININNTYITPEKHANKIRMEAKFANLNALYGITSNTEKKDRARATSNPKRRLLLTRQHNTTARRAQLQTPGSFRNNTIDGYDERGSELRGEMLPKLGKTQTKFYNGRDKNVVTLGDENNVAPPQRLIGTASGQQQPPRLYAWNHWMEAKDKTGNQAGKHATNTRNSNSPRELVTIQRESLQSRENNLLNDEEETKTPSLMMFSKRADTLSLEQMIDSSLVAYLNSNQDIAGSEISIDKLDKRLINSDREIGNKKKREHLVRKIKRNTTTTFVPFYEGFEFSAEDIDPSPRLAENPTSARGSQKHYSPKPSAQQPGRGITPPPKKRPGAAGSGLNDNKIGGHRDPPPPEKLKTGYVRKVQGAPPPPAQKEKEINFENQEQIFLPSFPVL